MTDWQFRPARDLGLPLGRRLRSQDREPGLLSALAHRSWGATVRCYLSAFHTISVTGRANLPAEPPFVMVANHSSHLDALALSAALPGAVSGRAYSLAAADVFFGSLPTAGFAALAINALPVWRKHSATNDLALLRARLVEDRLVFILFPEGTRSRTGEMGRFRPGIGAFVAGSTVPVVPCYLHGAHAAWPADRRLPRPGKLSLSIGQPLRFADLANDRDGWVAVAGRCEDAVRGLG